jgi:hypothetical protein
MKTVKIILGKAMIVTAALFFLGLAIIPNGPAKAITTVETTSFCGVSDLDVIKYLNEHGYDVIELRIVDGCCDRMATTQNPYQTRVYIQDSRILGHEDQDGI